MTKKKRTTQKAIAAQVGIGPDFLSHIIRGRKSCPRDLAPKLEAITDIEKSIWMWPEPDELRVKVHDFIYSEPK
jgi:plasmid maintenance system antidote protein VapI